MKPRKTAHDSPIITRLGVAPRFPKVANYLKSYQLSHSDWNNAQIPSLQQFAAGKGEAALMRDGRGPATIAFWTASLHLIQCSQALQWHAVQAALGNAQPAPRRTKPVTEAATRKEFERLVQNGKSIGAGRPAMAGYTFKRGPKDPLLTREQSLELDREITESEFQIVRHLLLQGHAPDAIEAALIEFGPALAERKGKRAASYAAQTLARAETDEDLKTWRAAQAVEQRQAQELAASGTTWLDFWRRSVAYAYWSCRMTKQCGGLLNRIDNIANAAANCLALGWIDQAVILFHQLAESIERNAPIDNDKGPKVFHQRRTQFFLLRLVAQWQGFALPPLPAQADDEPLFSALLLHWRSPDADSLAPLLLAACDRHTHLALIRKESPDFGTSPALTYLPFEILALLRVREILRLPNPTLDHPLMSTALGALPPVSEFFREDLLDAVVKRARGEFAAL